MRIIVSLLELLPIVYIILLRYIIKKLINNLFFSFPIHQYILKNILVVFLLFRSIGLDLKEIKIIKLFDKSKIYLKKELSNFEHVILFISLQLK